MLSKKITKIADKSGHRNLEGFSMESPSARASNATWIYASIAAIAATAIGAADLSAAVFYRVRELLAGLLLFSVLLGVVILAVLILWLVERATRVAAARLQTHMVHILARHHLGASRAHAGHIP
jgi:hypothetical protein